MSEKVMLKLAEIFRKRQHILKRLAQLQTTSDKKWVIKRTKDGHYYTGMLDKSYTPDKTKARVYDKLEPDALFPDEEEYEELER